MRRRKSRNGDQLILPTRWRMLDPTKVARSGKIPAITYNTPNGVDKLGVLAKSDGLLFVRRDDQGAARPTVRYVRLHAHKVRRSAYVVPVSRLLAGTPSSIRRQQPALPQVPRAQVSIAIQGASVSSPQPGSQAAQEAGEPGYSR